jgi:hypothetical protein
VRRTPLWWFASVWLLTAGGCLGSDLPSVVSRGSPDAANQAPPPIRSSVGDVEDASFANNLAVADASQPSVSESGEIALTIGLPIDTSTGQVASLGSLTVRLSSDGGAPRSLTLQLSHPSGEINLRLANIAAGGPYTLDLAATANGGVACAGSSPPFFVPALETVRVLESIICGADAGLTSTLYPGPSL